MLWLARSVGFDAVGGSVLTVHGILGCSLYHPRGLEAQTEIGKSSYDILPSSPLAFHSIIVADSILHTLNFSSLQLYTFRPFLCNSTTEYYTLLRTRFERGSRTPSVRRSTRKIRDGTDRETSIQVLDWNLGPKHWANGARMDMIQTSTCKDIGAVSEYIHFTHYRERYSQ